MNRVFATATIYMTVHTCMKFAIHANHICKPDKYRIMCIYVLVWYQSIILLEKRNMSGVKDLLKSGEDFKKDLKEKEGDWKSKLSGAFSSEQIFFSLFVLGVFYAGYTVANIDRNFDVDTKHEGDIIESCYCKSTHQDFYRTWFAICCALWFILHSYTYVAIRFRSCENFLKFIEAICHRIPKYLLKCSKGLLKNCYKFCCARKDSDNATATSGTKDQPGPGNNLYAYAYIIQHYIKVLWFKYYKLYVIGYVKGKDEKINLDRTSDDKVKDTNDKSDDDNKEKVTCFCCTAYIDKKVEDSNTEQAFFDCNTELNLCFNILQNISHVSLVSVKYLAQLLTMPLLFLQTFDTYSLLCFSPRLLCSHSSEYKLHLAQAAITLLFYCTLALSQLASTMLNWHPWPKKDDESDEKPAETNNKNST